MMGSRRVAKKRRYSQGGYTIIEMMIVLAISAAMFVAAVTAFGGRQQEIQFSQAVRDFDSRIQDISNDISTGFFDNAGNVGCAIRADGTINVGTSVGGAEEQGESLNCVFIGKVIQFNPESTDQPDQVNIASIVGRRSVGTASVNNIDDASPTVVTDTAQSLALEWGLRVTKVTDGGGSANYGAIVFLTSFSNPLGSGLNQVEVSNNQLIASVPVAGLNQSIGAIANAVTNIDDAALSARSTTFICLQKADGSRRAAVVIGENNSGSTTVLFDDQRVEDKCG